MDVTIPHINTGQLIFACVFILAAQAASLLYGLGLARDLFTGTLRTFGQLFLMGYALNFIFRLDFVLLTLGVILFMNFAAARIVKDRITERRISFMPPLFLSMLASGFIVSVLVCGVIIQADPWWTPRYFIPITGMIIGNTMSALSICLERLFVDLREQNPIIEMQLCLGADYVEATEDIVKKAMKAGMIPSINSMMGVGIVFLPGMMTGQILAGADPMDAIRYQIVVMLMLVGSTTIGSFVVVKWVVKKCFDRGQAPILGRQTE